MLLAFDLTGTQRGSDKGQNGGGEYIKSLMTEIVARRAKEALVFVAVEGRDFDPDVAVLAQGFETRYYQGNDGLSRLLAELAPDVFFSGLPYAYDSVKLPPATRAVYTIHGLRDVECPTDQYRSWYDSRGTPVEFLKRRFTEAFPSRFVAKKAARFRRLFNSMDESDMILAVSEHTRFSILNHFEVPRSPITVAYSPEKPRKERGPAVGGPPYLLLVNGDRWIKNSVRAVFAFDDLVGRMGSRLGGLVLRVTGGIPEKARRRLKHPDRVILLGYQTDEGLESLYADALALFYPSLNEGFGYPPLEAMKYGTPVLSAAVTSLTEVCGAGALFFDPRSIDEMQGRILAVLDPDVQKRLRQKALNRYQEIAIRQNQDKATVVDILLGRSANA